MSLNVLSVSESPTIFNPPKQLHSYLAYPLWIMHLKIFNVTCHFIITPRLFIIILISKTRKILQKQIQKQLKQILPTLFKILQFSTGLQLGGAVSYILPNLLYKPNSSRWATIEVEIYRHKFIHITSVFHDLQEGGDDIRDGLKLG